MSTIENVKFNEDSVTTITFGGTELSKLVMPDGNIWEPNQDTTPSLEVKLFGLDTDGKMWYDYYNTSYEFMISSAASVVFHVKGSNTGGITFTPAMNGGSSTRRISMIDNYAFMLCRIDGYGSWAGGMSGNTSSGTCTFTAVNDTSLKYTFKVASKIDENNTVLLRGDMVSKAIRVPSNGMSSTIQIAEYPYTFSSDLYFEQLYLVPVIYTPSTGNIDKLAATTEYSNSGIDISISEGDSSIDYVCNYTIEANTTQQFKEYSFIIDIDNLHPTDSYATEGKRITCTGTFIHFIQEPYKKNRIYYGLGFKSYKTFSDEHNLDGLGKTSYHAFFETCNSMVLTDDYTLTTAKNYYIAYPVNFDYLVSIDSGSCSTMTSSYPWGEQNYTILKIDTAGTITFTKK